MSVSFCYLFSSESLEDLLLLIPHLLSSWSVWVHFICTNNFFFFLLQETFVLVISDLTRTVCLLKNSIFRICILDECKDVSLVGNTFLALQFQLNTKTVATDTTADFKCAVQCSYSRSQSAIRNVQILRIVSFSIQTQLCGHFLSY